MRKVLYFGSREEIALCGPVTHNQNGMLLLQAFNGMREPGGQKQVVSFATGTADLAVALDRAQTFLDFMRKEWDTAYARAFDRQDQPAPHLISEAIPDSSVKSLVEKDLARLESDIGPGPTLCQYRQEALAFFALLGEKSQLPPGQITPAEIASVGVMRLKQLGPDTDAGRKSKRVLRFLLQRIPGLSQDCLEALPVPKNPSQKAQGSHGTNGTDGNNRTGCSSNIGSRQSHRN